MPQTGYQYDKFKSEAMAFFEGAKSAQRLSRVSEDIKMSRGYKNLLQKKKLQLELLNRRRFFK